MSKFKGTMQKLRFGDHSKIHTSLQRKNFDFKPPVSLITEFVGFLTENRM